MTRALKIDMTDLGLAFDAPEGLEYYLDVRTGEVLLVSDEAHSSLEQLMEEFDDDVADLTEDMVIAALAKTDLSDMEKAELLTAFRAETGTTDDLISIPRDESRDGYRDMESFVEGLTDERARASLERALSGSGPFRRFKDALDGFPRLRERWFSYRDERQEARIREWLADEGIELVTDPEQ